LGNGRYLVGLGRKFLTFPTTYESIRLGVSFKHRDADNVLCRSRDGLVFSVQISFQYLLSQRKEDLVRLYLDFGSAQKYRTVYVKIAQSAFRDVCSRFVATEFITTRQLLAEQLETEIDTRLRRVYASVVSLELVNMEFNEQFMTQIELTQVAKQDVLLANFELQVAQVDAEKNLTQASTLATLLVRSANATANALLSQTQADANALVNRIRAQTDAFTILRANLSLTTSHEILAYHWFSVLQDTPASTLRFGLDYPNLIRALVKGNSTG